MYCTVLARQIQQQAREVKLILSILSILSKLVVFVLSRSNPTPVLRFGGFKWGLVNTVESFPLHHVALHGIIIKKILPYFAFINPS